MRGKVLNTRCDGLINDFWRRRKTGTVEGNPVRLHLLFDSRIASKRLKCGPSSAFLEEGNSLMRESIQKKEWETTDPTLCPPGQR